MKRVRLQRIDSGDDCTLGRVSIDGKEQCVSLELPWRGNARKVSCIPAGAYICKMITRPNNKGRAYEITNVPGRSAILIHVGNTVRDIQGCVLFGMKFGTKTHEDGVTDRAVLQSALAIKAFNELMGGEDFVMDVIGAN